MRITESHLRRIIRQEVASTIVENRRARGSRALYEERTNALKFSGLKDFEEGSWADVLIQKVAGIAKDPSALRDLGRKSYNDLIKPRLDNLLKLRGEVEKEHPLMADLDALKPLSLRLETLDAMWKGFAHLDADFQESAFKDMHKLLTKVLEKENEEEENEK